MLIKLILFISLCLNLFIFSYYIISNEKKRIKALIKRYNSPIKKIYITLFNTYIKSKEELYVQIFSSDDVILHEIAHSLCKSIGHTDEFYNIYNKLIN